MNLIHQLLAGTLIASAVAFVDCRGRSSSQPVDRNVVLQSKQNTCGPAALSMLLTSLGQPASEAELEVEMSPGPDGVTLTALVDAAASRGVRLEAWRVRADTLSAIRPPAILWIDGDHFVVFDSITSAGVFLRDPSAGRVVVTPERLRQRWDGTSALVVRSPSP